MKRVVSVLVVLVAAAAISWHLLARSQEDSTAYRFVTVERGTVESLVSATGSLEALTTVEVGTQVSGQVAEIYVDFNDRVRRGQLVARIDPTLLEQEVRSTEATLARRVAAAEQAEWEFGRAKTLRGEGVINESDLETARFNHSAAQADLAAARVALERARRNLGYTEIRAPIDGVVVARSVDVGQTVAASLSAPVLFRIAEDLSRMRILAAVDESDIGKIHEGQVARFTVQAYPDESFSGAVRQVRLQSTTLENVVNYTVVVEVDNAGGRLLPGMTATVDFLIDSAENVLKVSNAALRFRPTEAMMAELRARRSTEGSGGTGGAEDSRGQGDSGRERGGHRRGQDGQGPSLLWYVDDDGRVNAMPVSAGITDGRETAVVGSRLEEGMQVIAGTMQTASSQSAASPFQPAAQPQRRGPGGPIGP